MFHIGKNASDFGGFGDAERNYGPADAGKEVDYDGAGVI